MQNYFNEKEASYIRSGEFLLRVLHEIGLISSARDHYDEVTGLFLCMARIDKYYDTLSESVKKETAAQILAYIIGQDSSLQLEEEHKNIAISLDWLRQKLQHKSEDRRNNFIKKVVTVFKCGQILAETKNPEEFSWARKREAVAMIDMFTNFVDGWKGDLKISKALRQVAIMGNLYDSLEDAHKDYRNGEIRIKPSVLSFALAKACCRQIPRVFAHVPNKEKLFPVFTKWIIKHAYRGLIKKRMAHSECVP